MTRHEFTYEMLSTDAPAAERLWPRKILRLFGLGQTETEQLRLFAPPMLQDRSPLMDDLRLRPGPEVAARVRDAVLCGRTIMLKSDPGIGKTFTVLQELRKLKDEDLIKGVLHLVALKTVQPEDWFDNRLSSVETRDGEPKIVLQKAVFLAPLNDPELICPVDKPTEAALAKQKDPKNAIVIFVDEITRSSAVLIDSFLEKLENGTFLVDGVKVRIPIIWIFAGNVPGTDQSCVQNSSAFRDRLTEERTLYSADLDVLVDLYIPQAFQKEREMYGYPAELLPSRELRRLACISWQMLNGWPLDRPCYANTLESTKTLLRELVERDVVLRKDAEYLGRFVTKGPAGRKPILWNLLCVHEAWGRRCRGQSDALVTPEDFLATCVPVLTPGYQLNNINEYLQANEVLEIHCATYRLVSRIFHNRDLHPLIHTSEGPYSIACRLVDRLIDLGSPLPPAFGPGSDASPSERRLALIDYVSEILVTYQRQLERRDRQAAARRWRTFADLTRKLDSYGPPAPSEKASEPLVELACSTKFLSQAQAEFICLPDQVLTSRLATLPNLNELGRRFADLRITSAGDQRVRPILPAEYLRDLCQTSELAWEFGPEVARVLRRHSELVPRLPDAVKLLDRLLEKQLDPKELEAVLKNVALTGSQSEALHKLLRMVGKRLDIPFAKQFKRAAFLLPSPAASAQSSNAPSVAAGSENRPPSSNGHALEKIAAAEEAVAAPNGASGLGRANGHAEGQVDDPQPARQPSQAVPRIDALASRRWCHKGKLLWGRFRQRIGRPGRSWPWNLIKNGLRVSRAWTLVLMAAIVMLAAWLRASGGSDDSLLGLVSKGGVFVYPLLACGFSAWFLILGQCFNVRRPILLPEETLQALDEFQQSHDCEPLREHCAGNDRPLAQAVGSVLWMAGMNAAEIQEQFDAALKREFEKIDRKSQFLATLAGLTPMLGLCGTVQGMILAFRALFQHGAGDPRQLAGGIYTSLIATFLGLVIAAPCFLASKWFSHRMDHYHDEATKRLRQFGKTLADAAPAGKDANTRAPSRNGHGRVLDLHP